MVYKILAIALAITAFLLLVVAASILGSSPRSLLMIVGLVAGLGAAVLFLFAISVFLRNPQSNKRHRHQLTAGQRMGMATVGLVMVLFAIRDVVNGTNDPVRGSQITRAQQPSEFWQSVLIYLSAGGVLIFLSIRKPPNG